MSFKNNNSKKILKTALITGSEGQLGRQFVAGLNSLNYKVIAFDIINEPINQDVDYFKVDIRDPDQIKNAIENIDNLDILINNAGVSCFSPFESRTIDELNNVIDVNLKGTIFMTQAIFKKYFKKQKYGCIVNIGSVYGKVSGDMRIYKEEDRRTPEIYGATKAAVINLTKYFAAYMAPYNVRVNSISPGGVYNNQSEDFVRKYSNKVPLGRMANENEFQTALEFLISHRSSYVTGQDIVVDGGLLVY